MTFTVRDLSSFSSYAHDVRRLLPQGRSPVLSGIVRVPAIPGRNRSRKNLRKSDAVGFAEVAESVDSEPGLYFAVVRQLPETAVRHWEVLSAVPGSDSVVAEPKVLPTGRRTRDEAHWQKTPCRDGNR